MISYFINGMYSHLAPVLMIIYNDCDLLLEAGVLSNWSETQISYQVTIQVLFSIKSYGLGVIEVLFLSWTALENFSHFSTLKTNSHSWAARAAYLKIVKFALKSQILKNIYRFGKLEATN